MIKYEINGGKRLQGTVTISGAKNAAVAILPAALLVSGSCRIENVPDISDVRLLLQILADMGVSIRRKSRHTLELDCTRVRNIVAPIDLVRRIRASYYLIGAELGRFGQAKVAMPGGCNFGVRPIDQHIKGFEALGACVDQLDGYVCADAPDGGLTGGHVYLDMVSVGATMNIMIAAVLAKGTTIIENCAKEPHIVDLANFLNAMGAKVSGAGTDVIKIRGVSACGKFLRAQINRVSPAPHGGGQHFGIAGRREYLRRNHLSSNLIFCCPGKAFFSSSLFSLAVSALALCNSSDASSAAIIATIVVDIVGFRFVILRSLSSSSSPSCPRYSALSSLFTV